MVLVDKSLNDNDIATAVSQLKKYVSMQNTDIFDEDAMNKIKFLLQTNYSLVNSSQVVRLKLKLKLKSKLEIIKMKN